MKIITDFLLALAGLAQTDEQKEKADVRGEAHKEMLFHLCHRFSELWLLPEEMFVLCENDAPVVNCFQAYEITEMHEKRCFFIDALLRAAVMVAHVQEGLLCKELVSANRLRIMRLPPELRKYYETEYTLGQLTAECIEDFNHELTKAGAEEEFVDATDGAQVKKVEDGLFEWQDVYIPEEGPEREEELAILLDGIMHEQLVVRFCKKLFHGDKPDNEKEDLVFSPNLAPGAI